MSRLSSIALVVAVWAMLYLPWLGSSGLRSEEGHRVLPAVEMIGSGNYLVPHIAGEPYLRKPPLINWLVAASFKLTGLRNEWTARAPSIIAVLVVALMFIAMTPPLLGQRGAICASLAWLTSLGMLEKGRMIEIEAVYVSLLAVAFICWLSWRHEQRSAWLTWTAPWIFLGLGLLAKGPAHLLFFYALIIFILWRTKRLRDLVCVQHLLGIFIMIGIFASWAYPCARALRSEQMSHTWTRELVNRFTGSEGTLNDWLLNWPLAFAYFLPFGLTLPFVRFEKLTNEDREVARGLFWGAIIPFLLVLLLPGAIQRYVLPTLVPACVLIGLAVKSDAFIWRVPRKAVLALMLVIAVGGAIIFPLRSATVQKARPAYDATAEPVNRAVPPGETLFAIDVGYQPYLFYIRAPLRYLSRLDQLPANARFFIVRAKLAPHVQDTRLILRTASFRGETTLLYAR